MAPMRFGASAEEWQHFSETLGLTVDLLPVVSDPRCEKSRSSKIGEIGKIPSRLNSYGRVTGFGGWTDHYATRGDILKWQVDDRHGICIQTRELHALDFDVTDKELAAEAERIVSKALGDVCIRFRGNAPKFLVPLYVLHDGDPLRKRAFHLQDKTHGLIEFLAHGQQFIAVGTHPSGARYEWRSTSGVIARPERFPSIPLEQFEVLWTTLHALFGDTTKALAEGARAKKLSASDIASRDPVGAALIKSGRVLDISRDGMMSIVCPWSMDHTDGKSEGSSTVYWPANTGGFQYGAFNCKHTHCLERTTAEFKREIRIEDEAEFDDLTIEDAADEGPEGEELVFKVQRFSVLDVSSFLQAPPPRWLIKGVLPEAGLAVVYGESGSGKSFFVLDMIAAIARGEAWRGRRVAQAPCLYICAEGVGGARNRLDAYCKHAGLSPRTLNIGVIADAPNLLKNTDTTALIGAVNAWGERPAVIVVDTFAQATPGGNENSGEDVGRALEHCKDLHRETGAMVLLVHHSGKDKGKGARGWSGLRAAADVEIEVSREEGRTLRQASVTKMKDGDEGAVFPFKLGVVEIGRDEDRMAVTSCVVEHLEVAQRSAQAPALETALPQHKRSVLEQTVLETIMTFQDLSDKPEEGVSTEEIILQVGRGMVYDSHRDTRRVKILKALEQLTLHRVVEGLDGRVFYRV